jgi:hypothetical protein
MIAWMHERAEREALSAERRMKDIGIRIMEEKRPLTADGRPRKEMLNVEF